MTSTLRHLHVCGGTVADRARLISAMDLPPCLIGTVDAHARLRGPYTAGGVIVRAVAAGALLSAPALVHDHDIEIRALVPELRHAVPLVREVLTESVPPAQRTRIYPRLRTRRLAHGVADLLRDYLRGMGGGTRTLVIENMRHADRSDRELVAVLLGRLDPALLTIVACDAAEDDPSGDPLGDALTAHAVAVHVQTPATAAGPGAGPADGGQAVSPAARYVNGDGVSDDPALLSAYAGLTRAARAILHDARADELARGSEFAPKLGAIVYHRLRGSDPAGAGVRALAEAAGHCFAAGFHDAVADLGARGRQLVTPERDPVHWWLLTSLTAGSLAALGRGAEAEALYDEARRASTEPAVHRTAAYETAMLHARHHDPSRRDPVAARRWINEAIALASTGQDPAERAFNLAFSLNGLALVEMRIGNGERALELVDRGLALFERELPAGSHPLDHCSLLANRARLLTAKGSLTESLAVHDALVALDPTYGEYHFERGNLLRLLGRDDEALTAYAGAEGLSLPFPELHYNRADLFTARGEDDAALADLDRVLELDPEFLDAHVNRAGILAARGDGGAAWPDVKAGLSTDPGNPYLLCVLGQLETARGRPAAARAAFDAALAAGPGLAAAWASRAALQFEAGDPEAAVADLTQALEQGEDSSLLFNRAVAHRAAGRLDAARDDAERSLELRPGDVETLALLAEITP